MTDLLAAISIGASLLLAGWALVEAGRGRALGAYHVIGVGVVELVLLLQTVVAVVLLGTRGAPPELGVFLTYLVITLLVPPIGLVWGLTEKSRWGPGVLAVAAVTVPVLVVRLQQLWAAGGG